MIEINLLPGQEKRKKRAGGGLPIKLPSSLPEFDRITAFTVAAWIIAPLLVAWMFFGIRSERAELETALEQARADSVRYARLIDTQSSLEARQDTIAQKLAMIQEIDAGRYIWPHILDEVSRALPPYTWIESLNQQTGGTEPRFIITGRTGSLPALTRFMTTLESSPFLRNIELISSEQTILDGDQTRVVNSFTLTGNYQHPPLEMIETVPLFSDPANGPALEAEEVEDGA
jgi:Tfp pilus assembly protein PilN